MTSSEIKEENYKLQHFGKYILLYNFWEMFKLFKNNF